MDAPDDTREIVDRLGVVLTRALVDDECAQALVKQIKDRGFDVALMLEVAMTLHKCNDGINSTDAELGLVSEDNIFNISSDDRELLRAFRISVE